MTASLLSVVYILCIEFAILAMNIFILQYDYSSNPMFLPAQIPNAKPFQSWANEKKATNMTELKP